jgi:aprataxin
MSAGERGGAFAGDSDGAGALLTSSPTAAFPAPDPEPAGAGASEGAGAGAPGLQELDFGEIPDRCFAQDSRTALASYAREPWRFPRIVVLEDADCVIVHDRFPKARLHFLLLPKPHTLRGAQSMSDLVRADEAAVRALVRTARAFAERAADDFSRQHPDAPRPVMSAGVHTIPSLRPLHVHIISEDLLSRHVKTKKHYNSFATDFFFPLEELAETLKHSSGGPLEVHTGNASARLVELPICNRCHSSVLGPFANFLEHVSACTSGRLRARW